MPIFALVLKISGWCGEIESRRDAQVMVECGKVPNQTFLSAMYSICCCKDEESN